MRNPIRSETDAFHITLAITLLICVAVAVGAIVGAVVAVAVLVSALVGALVWELCTKDPDRRRSLREAVAAARREEPGEGPRLLVIANRTLHDDELRAALRRREGAKVHIVVPIVTSRVRYIASDVDKELAEAGERLAAALTWAQAEGIAATGRIGDPNVALGAIEDELRRYGADEVIISTFAPGRSNWLETGIVERLRDELDIPVTHIVVDAEPDGGGDAGGGAGRSRNSSRHLAGRRAARRGDTGPANCSTVTDH